MLYVVTVVIYSIHMSNVPVCSVHTLYLDHTRQYHNGTTALHCTTIALQPHSHSVKMLWWTYFLLSMASQGQKNAHSDQNCASKCTDQPNLERFWLGPCWWPWSWREKYNYPGSLHTTLLKNPSPFLAYLKPLVWLDPSIHCASSPSYPGLLL